MSRSAETDTSTKLLLTGGTILTLGTLASNGGNYVLNLLLGRWLTPEEFADANLMVTLMLLITAVAVGLQLIVAKFVSGRTEGTGSDREQTASLSVLRWTLKLGWLSGLFIGFVLVAGSLLWKDLFKTESATLFIVLGLCMPYYTAQACHRGYLQGRLEFLKLAATYVIEAIARLSISIGLVVAGFGVLGATIGLGLSFIATWASARWFAVGRTRLSSGEVADEVVSAIKAFIAPTAVLLVAQIIINNGDVLITKSSFAARDAGIYAAVALVGRAVFFLSWSVVTAFFPVASSSSTSEAGSGRVLRLGIATVGGMCISMCLGIAVLGNFFLSNVLGSEYSGQGRLLLLYAIATSLFAVANYIASHKLAESSVTVAKFLVGAAVLQTVLVYLMRATAEGVVYAQLIAMGVALLGAIWLVKGDLLPAKGIHSPPSLMDP